MKRPLKEAILVAGMVLTTWFLIGCAHLAPKPCGTQPPPAVSKMKCEIRELEDQPDLAFLACDKASLVEFMESLTALEAYARAAHEGCVAR
jgi:hypothetical protein